jgi:hypothetical protein
MALGDPEESAATDNSQTRLCCIASQLDSSYELSNDPQNKESCQIDKLVAFTKMVLARMQNSKPNGSIRGASQQLNTSKCLTIEHVDTVVETN